MTTRNHNNRSALRLMLTVFAVTLFCASPALAQQRPRKPSVCANYQPIEVKGGKALICFDGTRPSLWTGGWTTVTVGKDTFAVGFRSAR